MASNCLGSVPQQFDIENVADFLYLLWKWGFFDPSNSGIRSWFWIAGMGELILKPFGLYDAAYSSTAPYLLPAGPFSSSQDYVTQTLVKQNPNLATVNFYTLAPNRPTLIVNMNLMWEDEIPDPPQMPIQAMAIATGTPGALPVENGVTFAGGGSVESFAFTSTLAGQGTATTAPVTINRWYSLCDIAGSSSAFFAEYLLQYINKAVDDIVATIATKYGLNQIEKDLLEGLIKLFLDVEGSEILPSYNYWSLGEVSQSNPVNQSYGFSDGGDFDNTGILGALAQTGVNRIVAFINTETPISSSNSNYYVDGSLPLLFGCYYPATTDPSNPPPYESYGGMSANYPMSYVQVFDNSSGQLDELCAGLYNASCATQSGGTPGTASAIFTQTLTTVDNPVAGIAAGRSVTVVWVYNNRVDAWQGLISDTGLVQDLSDGQGATPHGPLANFPHYNTELQIYLPAEAVNMLAQLSAWNVQQAESSILGLFEQ
jgi:hypothetical protein